jgi:hypothetical protein
MDVSGFPKVPPDTFLDIALIEAHYIAQILPNLSLTDQPTLRPRLTP